MYSILSFVGSRFNNALHVQFHRTVQTLLDGKGEATLGLPEGLLEAYESAIIDENDVTRRTLGSEQTALIRSNDTERDRLYMSIRTVLLGLEFSSDSDLKALWPIVQAKFTKLYKGDVIHMGDQEETALIHGFIFDVRKFLTTQQLDKLGITADLAALESANNAFEQKFLARNAEYAANPAGLTDRLRATTDSLYDRIEKTLTYYANTLTTADRSLRDAARAVLPEISKIVKDFNMKANI